MAAEAGVDIVDCAIASMSSLTSQPSLNAVVAALQGRSGTPGSTCSELQKLSDYWADVRQRYASFETGLKNPSTDIYRYEIPGGQYTNLKPQVESLGLGHRFEEVKEMYKTVNDMLGDIVKVTPSSKMVGDLAIFMVQNDLTPENIVERGEALSLPRLRGELLQGHDGPARLGLPRGSAEGGAQGRSSPSPAVPASCCPPWTSTQLRQEVEKFYDRRLDAHGHLPTACTPRCMRTSAATARSTAISPAWAATCSSTAWPWARPTRSTSRTARPW